MSSPYNKAIRHAVRCAQFGLGVEACAYKTMAWRTAWLQAFEKEQQMKFDDFETDVKQAEDSINERNHDESTIQQPARPTDGDCGLCTEKQQSTTGDSAGNKAVKIGLFGGISNDDYHKGPGISSSNIKPALKSMNLYNETRCGRVEFKETQAMMLGTAVHALVLEAHDFGNQIAVSKKFGRTNVGKEERAEFHRENAGKVIINAEDYDRCRYMRDSLLNLEEVRIILESGEPEMSGYYVDRDEYGAGSNMLCKYRSDWENSWCIFDVKSTRDASAQKFSRTIHDLNYHVSAAHYLEGSRILTKQSHNQFIFGCVESEAPFEAAVYVLGKDSLEAGQKLRRHALNAIKQGRDSGEWPLLNNGIAQEIDIPGYALNDLRLSKI